jgi:hypothetical protein
MLLMLIDTADPRYSRPPEPRSRRTPGPLLRLWLPLAAAMVCLVVSGWVPPVLGYVLVMSSLGLFVQAATALLPRGDGLSRHRQ